MSLADLSRKIGFDNHDPFFGKVIRELMDLDYIVITRRIGQAKMVKIKDHKRIWALARQTEAYQSFVRGVVINEVGYIIPD